MEVNYLLLGKKIKKFRKRKRLSQYSLAERVNVSAPYISRIECGKNRISLELFVKVCKALETNAAEFLTENLIGEYSHITTESTGLEQKLMLAVCNAIAETMSEEKTL